MLICELIRITITIIIVVEVVEVVEVVVLGFLEVTLLTPTKLFVVLFFEIRNDKAIEYSNRLCYELIML